MYFLEHNRILSILKKGGITCLPTDTVYTITADACNKKAVENIFKIKKRKKDKSLPIFVSNIQMLNKIAITHKIEEEYMNKFWPGPLTIILKNKNHLQLSQFSKTIAIRIPKMKALRNLISTLNNPIIATSANISGKKETNSYKKIIKTFSKKVDLIVSNQDKANTKTSTIIQYTGSNIKIIREGAIMKKEILHFKNSIMY